MSPREEHATPQPSDRGPGLAGRMKLWLLTHVSAWAIRIIGATLRWEADGVEHLETSIERHGGGVAAFWHGRIFTSVYFWRNRGITVMTSLHRDGEYISRLIHLFGFQTARASSSRGARRALVAMMRDLRRSAITAFTVDGPRGPRYVAKEGAVWLAARMGRPLLPFNISAEKKWVLSSWDRFEIPCPFSRALMRMTPPYFIPAGASEAQLEEAQRWLQSTLDDLRERGDRHWERTKSRAGDPPSSPQG